MCMSHGVGSNEATIWKAYMFERYAIFYTPDDPGFAAFGAQWLGWDSAAQKAGTHHSSDDAAVQGYSQGVLHRLSVRTPFVEALQRMHSF